MSNFSISNQHLFRHEALLNGVWVSAERTLDVYNPATSEIIGSVPNLDGKATSECITSANHAFPGWSALTGKDRSVILRRWHDLMITNRDDLAKILTLEQGKPLSEAISEVNYAASFLEWFSEEAKRVNGEVLTQHLADKRLIVRREPVGVVAAITPWNFPLAMITRKVGPALAVGCTVVVKPSELTPFSALALGYLAEQAGVPAGVLNIITGSPEPIGTALIDDHRVRKFTFTGSTAVGKRLAARCMDTVKRVSLELGGNAPFIVFDDANVESAVEGALAAKYRNTGQTCVCANRILVQDGVYEEFAQRLTSRVQQLVVGDGLHGPTDQGPLINAEAIDKSKRHVGDAISKGGKILIGGKQLDRPGYFFEPTVIRDVPVDAMLCHEETFGPIAGLVRFSDQETAIACANDTKAGLACYVYTSNLDRSWRVSEALNFGIVGLNTGLISTEVAPFGGIKESGIGREGGRLGLDDYLDTKYVCIGLSEK